MKYLVLIYASEAEESKMTAQDTGKMMQAYGAYTEALAKAGVTLGSNRLRPSSEATAR